MAMAVNLMDILRINQAAQGICSLEESRAWFSRHDDDDQRALIREVGYLAMQAGAVPDDSAAAADYAGIKPGVPACVLMSKGVPKTQLAKVAALPSGENLRSFAFLLGLLGIADARRRQTKCAAGCSHWWHRDLRDEAVVAAILSGDGSP